MQKLMVPVLTGVVAFGAGVGAGDVFNRKTMRAQSYQVWDARNSEVAYDIVEYISEAERELRILRSDLTMLQRRVDSLGVGDAADADNLAEEYRVAVDNLLRLSGRIRNHQDPYRNTLLDNRSNEEKAAKEADFRSVRDQYGVAFIKVKSLRRQLVAIGIDPDSIAELPALIKRAVERN